MVGGRNISGWDYEPQKETFDDYATCFVKAMLAVAGVETLELGLETALAGLTLIGAGAGVMGAIAAGFVVIIGIGVAAVGVLAVSEAAGITHFFFKDDKDKR